MNFKEFIANKTLHIEKLKNMISSMYKLKTLDIDNLGKYILDEFYELSLYDSSNLLRPVDANKKLVPGIDSYNFNNSLYYKYNYYAYDFRHPMNLTDVLKLVDLAYENYDKYAIVKIHDYIIKNIRKE